ncbi:MAG: InlB B-repeat-containing protein, partial [Planctomycetota bacterium]
ATVTAVYVALPTYDLSVVDGVDVTAAGPYLAGATVTLLADAPAAGFAFDRWQATAGSFADAGSMQTAFTMPAESVTVTALYVEESSGPTDSDGDGVPDESDAFPLDPGETIDSDGDGTGDNADLDDDGDGVPDESDAFPLDPGETTDSDGDGTGDNADLIPWSAGAVLPLRAGQPLTLAQYGAVINDPDLVITYQPDLGTLLTAGLHDLTITVTPLAGGSSQSQTRQLAVFAAALTEVTVAGAVTPLSATIVSDVGPVVRSGTTWSCVSAVDEAMALTITIDATDAGDSVQRLVRVMIDEIEMGVGQ